MNDFMFGMFLGQILEWLFRVFKKIWWIPVSLFLADRIGAFLGELLNISRPHVDIISWVIMAILYIWFRYTLVPWYRSNKN